MTTIVQIHELRCLHCGHTWYPRRPRRPAICPKCGRARWDEPKAAPPSATEASK